jgi:hypothetical protein
MSATIAIKQIPDAVQRVTTMAALKAVQVSDGRSVILQGYYSTGDGGGGEFHASNLSAAGTYVDNGGSVIVPTGGDGSRAWLRDTRLGVSILHFGARCDGVTGDGPAIQAAINSLTGGVVEFPNRRTILLSTQVLLKDDVSIDGNECVININPLNWTGGITRFFAAFSTVNVTARPLVTNWRIGTGTVAFENIKIRGLIFNLNRDGATLSSGNMLNSDFNAIRLEDARNCAIEGCRFLDLQTVANRNFGHAVMLVRSEGCRVSGNFANQLSFCWLGECVDCVIDRNRVPVSVGSCIETVGGRMHCIENNFSGVTWGAVSAIGVNSESCVVKGNRVAESPLSGITIGHAGTSSYSVSTSASFCECEANLIESGDDLTVSHGYIGILVQNGSGIRIKGNTVKSLRTTGGFFDRNGGILIQPDAAADCNHIEVSENLVSTATSGIYLVRGNSIVVRGNYVTTATNGFVSELTGNTALIDFSGNFIESCTRAFYAANGYAYIHANRFSSISDATFSFTMSRGVAHVYNNIFNECGEFFAAIILAFSYEGNTILRGTPLTRAVNIDNSSAAGTATIDLIRVRGNYHPGATNPVRITGVLNQSTRFLKDTDPTQYRSTSFNVGSLPTSSAGLSAGDIWNDTGAVKVV